MAKRQKSEIIETIAPASLLPSSSRSDQIALRTETTT